MDPEKLPHSHPSAASRLPSFGLAKDILAQLAKPAVPAATMVEPAAREAWIKVVTFFLGQEEYALPVTLVREINRVGEITRVPNSPQYIRGIDNLRGKVIPIIELKQKLGLGPTELRRTSRTVVVESGPRLLGLLVDRVNQVISLAVDQIQDPPQEAVRDRNCIMGVVNFQDRMLLLLDLNKVFDSGQDV